MLMQTDARTLGADDGMHASTINSMIQANDVVDDTRDTLVTEMIVKGIRFINHSLEYLTHTIPVTIAHNILPPIWL